MTISALSSRFPFLLPLTAIFVLIAPAVLQAAVFRIGNGPTPRVSLSVGSTGATIDQVSFSVTSGQLGNNQPITGSTPIRIIVSNRAAPAGTRPATLTADSSIPLKNGNSELPFNTIRWTAQDNDIPSGAFNGSNNQTLLTFINSRLITDVHQFEYANSVVLEAGVYTGRVTYTLTMP
jgi:hypothetical protein